ncbi:hypothetical protein D3C81_2126930 [compost metagenome]
MAQIALPHIEGRVVTLSCPQCKEPHFDSGQWAYTPHIDHECHFCGAIFQNPSQIKKTISNPFVETRVRLSKHTNRILREDKLGLRPETI